VRRATGARHIENEDLAALDSVDEGQHDLEVRADTVEDEERRAASTGADGIPQTHAVDVDVIDLRWRRNLRSRRGCHR